VVGEDEPAYATIDYDVLPAGGLFHGGASAETGALRGPGASSSSSSSFASEYSEVGAGAKGYGALAAALGIDLVPVLETDMDAADAATRPVPTMYESTPLVGTAGGASGAGGAGRDPLYHEWRGEEARVAITDADAARLLRDWELADGRLLISRLLGRGTFS